MNSNRPIAGFALCLLAGAALAQTTGQTTRPAAEIAVAGDGPTHVTGALSSKNFLLQEELFPNLTVTLLNVGHTISGQPERLAGKDGQIIGYLTEPLFPGPGRYRVNLPRLPEGPAVDLDNDGADDPGVRVFALLAAANLAGDSYLEQAEQLGGLSSYITDLATGGIVEGRFIVHAPDDRQGFPVARGADGLWFTPDDGVARLPAGYTLAILSPDGTARFERAGEAVADAIERAEAATPDFSGLGILDSYHALLDTLDTRYAYTDFRGLDWQAIRAAHLDRVAAADAAEDIGAYYLALRDLALSIGDTHVAADPGYTDPATIRALATDLVSRYGGNLGAAVIETSGDDAANGRILVLQVGEGSPAAAAGWVPGTEIVGVDGMTVDERIASLPIGRSIGVPALQRRDRVERLLAFPAGQRVTVDFRLPGETAIRSATIEAGGYDTGAAPARPATRTLPIAYEQRGDYAILTWNSFMSFLVPKVVVLEEALKVESTVSSAGMVLDLRGNGGGLLELALVMASHFFTEENPLPVRLFDWYYFDAAAGTQIKAFAPDVRVSAPQPKYAYTGPLVVLIDEGCASACEYFTQFLQLTGRATVIGQYGSTGAGGPVERIAMPGGVTFQYTMGRTTFAGSATPNIEATGVTPDIRVPVSLETELAKRAGADPVMAAAIAELDRLSAPILRLTVSEWRWAGLIDGAGKPVEIDDPDRYTISVAEDGALSVTADCNRVLGRLALAKDDSVEISLGPATLAACPPGSRGEAFVRHLSNAATLVFQDGAPALYLLDDPDAAMILFAPP